MDEKPSEINRDELERLRAELERADARQELRQYVLGQDLFDERERRLISNCKLYAGHDPAGLPGHNLMIIVAKMARVMGL